LRPGLPQAQLWTVGAYSVPQTSSLNFRGGEREGEGRTERKGRGKGGIATTLKKCPPEPAA